jgi:hypothetical protein
LVPTTDGESVSCSCSNSLSPDLAHYHATTKRGCSLSDYVLQDLGTAYILEAFYDIAHLDLKDILTMEPSECFDQCRSVSKSYTLLSQLPSGAWQCSCSEIPPSDLAVDDCKPSLGFLAYFFDIHKPAPSDTPVHKRNLRERLQKKRRELIEDPCPAGMTACRVGSMDAFECLDVSSELGMSPFVCPLL